MKPTLGAEYTGERVGGGRHSGALVAVLRWPKEPAWAVLETPHGQFAVLYHTLERAEEIPE